VEGGPQALVGHVALDDAGDRRLEDDRDQLGVMAETLLDGAAVRGRPKPGVGPLAVGAPQGGADAGEESVVGQVTVDVGGRELGHGGGGTGGVVPQRQGGAVGERAPQVGIDKGHPQAAPVQPELLHHQRVQQADEVGAWGNDEALVGEGPLERRRPADLVPALQDQH
jgi:hypothetical protein